MPADELESLYDRAACGLLVTSADGLIHRVNRTFCDAVGREPDELVGRMTMQSLLTIGGRIFHQTHWTPLLQMQGSLAEVKLEAVHKDGRRIPMLWNAVRHVRDGVAFHELAVFVAEDRHRYEQELMQARRRAEEALRMAQAAQEALGVAQSERDRQRAVADDRALLAEQMVAVVSHDLRNPLAVIRMSAHLIGRGALTERQQRALTQLDSSTNRAIRLINDLLDFSQSRIGSGLQVDRTALDLHAVVDDSVNDLRVAFPAATLRHVQIGSGPFSGSADRLAQMIGNLVANAVAYGAPHLPITVTSALGEADCVIAVHNGGDAIPPERLPTLFDAMTRGGGGGGGIDSANHSIGLGLYIVREIARAHGGDVAVWSTEVSGTTFTATFPRGPAS